MNRVFALSLVFGAMLPLPAHAGTGVLQLVDSRGSGDYLFWNQQITKGCGYRTILQFDGNLVTYNGNQPVWSSGTWNQPVGYAYVSYLGNFTLNDWADRSLWETRTRMQCDLHTNPHCAWSNLRQGDDGNLRVVFDNRTTLWSSKVSGPVTTGDCASTPERVTRVMVDEDRPGGDYKALELEEARPSWCGGFCALEYPTCQSYTYVPAGVKGPRPMCFLKTSAPAAFVRKGMVSGVIVTR